jgi:hypothetical protein
MWRRTYAQLKNFSFNLLPVSPLFGKKWRDLAYILSLYTSIIILQCVCVLFVFVWYTCPPFSGVQSGEMEPSYSWPRLLSPPTGCMLYTLSILHLLWKYRPIVFLFALLSPNLSVLFQFLFSVSKWVQGLLACVRTCNQRRYNTRAIFL